MLSQQGLCCASPGADRSTSCGRPQVYLRGWRMASRRRRSRRRRRKRRIRRRRRRTRRRRRRTNRRSVTREVQHQQRRGKCTKKHHSHIQKHTQDHQNKHIQSRLSSSVADSRDSRSKRPVRADRSAGFVLGADGGVQLPVKPERRSDKSTGCSQETFDHRWPCTSWLRSMMA